MLNIIAHDGLLNEPRFSRNDTTSSKSISATTLYWVASVWRFIRVAKRLKNIHFRKTFIFPQFFLYLRLLYAIPLIVLITQRGRLLTILLSYVVQNAAAPMAVLWSFTL
jgi:hypothetical protein